MPDVTGVAAFLWLVTTLFFVRAWRAAPAPRVRPLPEAVRRQIFTVLPVIAEFRRGLDTGGAGRLRALLDVPAVVIVDAEGVLGWDGAVEQEHVDRAGELAVKALATGVPQPHVVSCDSPSCPARHAMTVPLKVNGEIRAALVVYSASRSAAQDRVLRAVAGWISDQLSLADGERLGVRGGEPPLFVLPAPIPAMFVSQSLIAVKDLTRTDPERATELLRELSDFLRYRSRQYSEFTELAEEVRCVDQYLVLAREQLGGLLTVVMDIAPEVLPLKVPFLCLQPLVEQIVQYGPGPQLTITVAVDGEDVVLAVEHDDPRLDYEDVPRFDASKPWWENRRNGYLGISDLPAFSRRLGNLYGEGFALDVDVRAEANTKITVRLPKL